MDPFGIVSDTENLFVLDSWSGRIRKINILSAMVSTLAGGATNGADGFGSLAGFNRPTGLYMECKTLYVADTWNNSIRLVDVATAKVTTLVGDRTYASDIDGAIASANITYPQGVTKLGSNLFVTNRNSIRKIDMTTGVVSTLAGGNIWQPPSTDIDGVGAAAFFYEPMAITHDGTYLYVADSNYHAIRKVVISTGEVTTLAGGTEGFADGVGKLAQFNYPQGIACDGVSLFVADSKNNSIRKIDLATGVVTTIGKGAEFNFDTPKGVELHDGILYVTDKYRVQKLSLQSELVTGLAGKLPGADGMGINSNFKSPVDVTSDGANLYIADTENHNVRKIVIATGEVTTFAGGGVKGNSDGIGRAARFSEPRGITTDGKSLFVADTGNWSVRKIDLASANVSTLAGGTSGFADGVGQNASFTHLNGITTDGHFLYLTDGDSFNNISLIRKVDLANASVSTLAGGPSGRVDGVGRAASFNFPVGITTDGKSLYVADANYFGIRRIVIATGEVTTLAGSAEVQGSEDGMSATFGNPVGITTDGYNVYVSDRDSIRKIDLVTLRTSTIAGGIRGYEEGPGETARFSGPKGITTDGRSLFVVDGLNETIRKIQ
ncbi:MAG TPA: hypothetical protein PK129_10035 [Cellvibrionaceae bacterium]|nr:hypothetical protein [Cellvibrionaceae bacterium]